MTTIHPQFADPQEWWERHVRDEHGGGFGEVASHGISPHKHHLVGGVVDTEWLSSEEDDARAAIERHDAAEARDKVTGFSIPDIVRHLAMRPSTMTDAVRQLASTWSDVPGYEPGETFEMHAEGDTLIVSVTRRRS